MRKFIAGLSAVALIVPSTATAQSSKVPTCHQVKHKHHGTCIRRAPQFNLR